MKRNWLISESINRPSTHIFIFSLYIFSKDFIIDFMHEVYFKFYMPLIKLNYFYWFHFIASSLACVIYSDFYYHYETILVKCFSYLKGYYNKINPAHFKENISFHPGRYPILIVTLIWDINSSFCSFSGNPAKYCTENEIKHGLYFI